MEQLQKSVQQIFADKLLKIPDYQRGYAWEKKHCEDLIEDLEVLLKDQEHYTGTLVLHLDKALGHIIDEEGNTLKIYDVVDGQQRLTTLIILLHCISQELRKNLNKRTFADGIKKNYIKIVDMENQEKARLTLNKDCHEFFVKNVISDAPTIGGSKIKSHQRLEQAMNFFTNYLNEKRKEYSDQYEVWLTNLHRKITNALKLTVYLVPTTSDVGVIFEVMNNRGKPLSEMEKVKNYLLYLSSKIDMEAAEELGERINSVWAFIFQRLMESDVSSIEYENQLLKTSWIMAYNYTSREWHGYSSIKDQFNLRKFYGKYEKLLEGLSRYVEILHQSCIAYCDILAPNHDESFNNFRDMPDVRRRLRKKAEKLARIGNRVPFLPLLMAARIRFPDDSEFLEGMLNICEKYAFRIYRMQRSRSNTGQSNLFKQGFDLFRRRVSKKFVLRNIKKNLLYYSPEVSFRNFFLEIGRDWYNFYGLKYFLYEYEEKLARGKGVLLPWDKLVKKDKNESIEHILPQAPVRSYWNERWIEEDIETYLHDIGNLTLTFDNSVYSNKPFPEKRGNPGDPNCYTTSNLFQEKELGAYEDWTLNELKKRRKEIIGWAIDRWSVDGELVEGVELDEEDYEEIETGEADDLINALDEEDDVLDEKLLETEKPKEWSTEEIYEYFDYLKNWGESTYYYFKVLASIGRRIGFDDLVKSIRKESGKDFHGRMLAGVFSGLTRRAAQKGGERLDKVYEEGWVYSLNKKYKDIIKRYFDEIA